MFMLEGTSPDHDDWMETHTMRLNYAAILALIITLAEFILLQYYIIEIPCNLFSWSL